MRQRRLGRSDIHVGAIGLGCMGFSIAYDPGTKDDAASERVIRHALDTGVTLFDTSDAYGPWTNEQLLGRALAGRRHEAIVATKAGCAPNAESFQPKPDGRPEVLRECCDASLARLGVDVIDLWQLHRADPAVPIEESVGAMGEMVVAGKVRAIGCSNLSVAELDEADHVATEMGNERFASIQSALNIFSRGALADLMPACERLGIAFIPYYPLANGVLSGKYGRDRPLPTGTRLVEQIDEATRNKILSDRTFARLEALETYARDRGHTVLELAFAWLLAFPAVATVIAASAWSRAAGASRRN